MPMTASSYIVVRGAAQDRFEDGDGGLAAFEREALLADEARVQEMLELLGCRSDRAGRAGALPSSSGQLLASGSMRCCSQRFCSGNLDVHVLAADFAAVGLAQGFQNLAQSGLSLCRWLRRACRRRIRGRDPRW